MEMALLEGVDVKYLGTEGKQYIVLEINGKVYKYNAHKAAYDFDTLVKKFQGIWKFSPVKAMLWLKKNTDPSLVVGSSKYDKKELDHPRRAANESLDNSQLLRTIMESKDSIRKIISGNR